MLNKILNIFLKELVQHFLSYIFLKIASQTFSKKFYSDIFLKKIKNSLVQHFLKKC
jgi:hypothetical protein